MNKPSVSAGVVAGVALGAAALGAAAVAVRAACLQVARTCNGLARVKRVHDEGGDEVRVLVQGGVYQSASYVGERWAEPVFVYYRAFDDVFEAEGAMPMLTGMDRPYAHAGRRRVCLSQVCTVVARGHAHGRYRV
ncbi:MAG: hypothetical protein ACLU1W_07900 [Collinsella sp.]